MTESLAAPPVLELGVSERIAMTAEALCSLKVDLDGYARGNVSQPYLNDWMDQAGTCAFVGDSFLKLIVPFLDRGSRDGPPFRAYVDPRYVLGACIKGYPKHIKGDEIPKRIKRYSEHFGTPENVHYIWVRPLGLFWAHEGKHRVAFMRSHNQPCIAAWVSEISYPTPDRLAIVQPDEQREDWLIVLDNRYVQVLRRPHLSTTVLSSYGVRQVRWRDLPSMPDKSCVLFEMYRRGLHKQPMMERESHRTLDLDDLRDMIEVDEAPIEKGYDDLSPNRFDWRRYTLTTAAFAFVSMLGHLSNWAPLVIASYISFGVACGLGGALSLIRYVGPRRMTGGRPKFDPFSVEDERFRRRGPRRRESP